MSLQNDEQITMPKYGGVLIRRNHNMSIIINCMKICTMYRTLNTDLCENIQTITLHSPDVGTVNSTGPKFITATPNMDAGAIKHN